MARTLTARFETEEEAERALAAVAAEVPLRDSAIVGGGVAGALTLESLHLTPDDRAACERQLSKGGFLVLAQVVTESRGEAVLKVLARFARTEEAPPSPPPQPAVTPQAPPPPVSEAPRAPSPPPAPDQPLSPAVAEERIPLVQEELRIGKREVVRGRSRVQTRIVEEPVREEVELLFEETSIERRPVGRRLSEEEVAEGGLLRERVVEIAEMREEAVITKEAFVREELVVTKSVHRRVEQIEETVRRTEVETERLEPEDSAPVSR